MILYPGETQTGENSVIQKKGAVMAWLLHCYIRSSREPPRSSDANSYMIQQTLCLLKARYAVNMQIQEAARENTGMKA